MTQTHKNILAGFSSLSFFLLFFGAGLVDNGKIDLDTYLWVQGVAIFLGLFTLVAATEKLVHQGLLEFKSSTLWWASGLAILGYYARISAMDDVNKVFHVDPSALPMTLIAAHAMNLFALMKWPFIIVASISLLWLIPICKGTYFSKNTPEDEKIASGIFAFSNMINCMLCAIFIYFQLDDVGRQRKIYRTAHAADFVSRFQCSGINSNEFSVLFIGPEQRKVLVAPKLPKPVLFNTKSAEFLQALVIPDKFPTVDCVPSVNFDEWARNLSLTG